MSSTPVSAEADLLLEADCRSEDASSAWPLLSFRFFSGGILVRRMIVVGKLSGGIKDYESEA